MTVGVLFYAKNNGIYDYLKQAEVAAAMVRNIMKVPVGIVYDEKDDFENDKGLFDETIAVNFEEGNIRKYTDGNIYNYFNIDRLDCFEISPFDETIVLDTDYLVQNDTLNQLWGFQIPLLMNSATRQATQWEEGPLNEVIAIGYPKLYWFTACYFHKKDSFVRDFYELCKEIQINYAYYSATYGMGVKLIRNDFIVSIASHIIGGTSHRYIKPLPVEHINSWEDEILDIKYRRMTLCNPNDPWPVVLRNRNIHLVRKDQIENNHEKFLEIYNEQR